jgi:hypothetical protein
MVDGMVDGMIGGMVDGMVDGHGVVSVSEREESMESKPMVGGKERSKIC